MATELILATIIAIGFIGAIMSGLDSIGSPIGMLVTTLGCVFLISYAFQDGDLQGWIMVLFSLYFLAMTLRAYLLYNRLNKKDDE